MVGLPLVSVRGHLTTKRPGWCVFDKYELSITAHPPFIPSGSAVRNGHVLTQSNMDLYLTKNGQPVSSVPVPLKSDRGKADHISYVGQGITAVGIALASVSTRDNPGTSTITSASATIETAEPAIISWLPAKFEAKFEITCYVIALETNYLDTKLVPAPGIHNQLYFKGFLKDTAMQGTGEALDGTYIHYQGEHNGIRQYAKLNKNCAPTSSTACAVDGVTAAVDRHQIPLHSDISIDGVGDRKAQDTGGGIGYDHIDLFYGTRRHDCIHHWGVRIRSVTFLDYGN